MRDDFLVKRLGIHIQHRDQFVPAGSPGYHINTGFIYT